MLISDRFKKIYYLGTRYLLVISVIIIFTWFIKGSFFSIYYIPTDSMTPTIRPGSYVLIVKFPYRLHTPDHWPLTDIPFPFFSAKGPVEIERGDIVIFDNPIDSPELHSARKNDLVKRCIGVPGDTLSLYTNYTKVNGKIVDRERNGPVYMNSDTLLQNWLISSDQPLNYFVAGDNRIHSFDSRYFGLLPEDNLIGRAVAVVWPWPQRWLK